MASDRDLVRHALYDAIGWQDGLSAAYAHMPEDPAYGEAVAQAKRYRALLKKRYGKTRTPSEAVDGRGKMVDIWTLQAGEKK